MFWLRDLSFRLISCFTVHSRNLRMVDKGPPDSRDNIKIIIKGEGGELKGGSKGKEKLLDESY